MSVVIGIIGGTLDQGRTPDRWQVWRPTVAVCRQPDLIVNRLDLLHDRRQASLAVIVKKDIECSAPRGPTRNRTIA